MRCVIVKGATLLLCLVVSVAWAADYSANVSYEDGDLYYAVYNTNNGSWARNCTEASKGVSFSANRVNTRQVNFYTDDACQDILVTVEASELFADGNSVNISVKKDGSWEFTEEAPPEGPGDPGKEPEGPGVDPGKDNPVKANPKIVAFFTPWTNTNAKMFMDGDSLVMKALDKYCGWFYAVVNNAPTEGFNVYFKQTIGPYFVGGDSLTQTAPTIATEISLDSVAALGDTIWVKGNQEGAPGIYSRHPAGVLGDCPIKKLPVMMFDWLHGNKGDGDGKGKNGDPANGVSADFGSGGCSGSPMKGMVATELGPNGVPVRADPFPSGCKITEHLDYWFLPESLAVDAQGNTLTNMTCRDLYISMDDEGFWLAEVSKDGIYPDSNRVINKGGMFLLDDFEYLDSAGTVPNPYYESLSGGSDNGKHNFGFTMKVQATFEYLPGQYFDFLGDDDVWVFINNKLVVDIGGQHAQVAGAVDLDTIGQNNPADKLVPGETYNFHIFYAERHTSSSNFRMHTSIDLKTEASIMLKNVSEDADIISREVWQKVRKNKLACDFSEAGKELSFERGASVYTLFGGNLPSEGLAIDTAGKWFGGITIGKDFDEFSIDKEAIKDAHALSPGVYYLRVALVSDVSQYKDIYFVVGAYSLPNLIYADSAGKALGSTILSDTLPLNMNKDVTMWVGQSYKVYIQYAEDWAKGSDVVYPSTDDDALVPCDSLGNPITEVKLDSGRAVFYLKAVGETWGASLYVKGQAAGNTASWRGINFALPPVPQIETAHIYDRDGDGRGDSVWIQFNGELGGKNSLDSARVTFGTLFEGTYAPAYRNGENLASFVADGDGFGSAIFTGGLEKPYTGKIIVWFTYTDNGRTSVFPAEGQLVDKIGPVVTAAEVSYMNDGNAVLVMSFSEGLNGDNASSDLFRFHCWKNGVMDSLVKSASDITKTSAYQWKLIFPKGGDSDLIPAVGDSVRFVPPSQLGMALDLVDVGPHENNQWIRVTGEQKVTITSPGVVTLGPGTDPAVFDSAKAIVRSDSATVPKLVKDESILTAEQAAGVYGTQGHFLGDLNMAELVENEIADIMKAVQGTPIYTDKRAGKDETAQTYSIQQIIAMVQDGQMSIGDAKKRFGLDPIIVDAYKNKMLTAENVDRYARGTDADIRQLAEAVAENTELRYKSTYYSSLGEFVNSNSGTITCNGDIFKDNGQGNCLDNNGKLFLAWNMRAKNGRLASTGVYIARIEYRIKVGSKTVVDRTQDFLWGVRRGKANALDFGF